MLYILDFKVCWFFYCEAYCISACVIWDDVLSQVSAPSMNAQFCECKLYSNFKQNFELIFCPIPANSSSVIFNWVILVLAKDTSPLIVVWFKKCISGMNNCCSFVLQEHKGRLVWTISGHSGKMYEEIKLGHGQLIPRVSERPMCRF